MPHPLFPTFNINRFFSHELQYLILYSTKYTSSSVHLFPILLPLPSILLSSFTFFLIFLADEGSKSTSTDRPRLSKAQSTKSAVEAAAAVFLVELSVLSHSY